MCMLCTGLTYDYVLAGIGRARSIHRLRPKTALSPFTTAAWTVTAPCGGSD